MARHKRRYRVGDVLEVIEPFLLYKITPNRRYDEISYMPTVFAELGEKLLVSHIYEQRDFLGVSAWGTEYVLIFKHAARGRGWLIEEGLPHRRSIRKLFDTRSNSQAPARGLHQTPAEAARR